MKLLPPDRTLRFFDVAACVLLLIVLASWLWKTPFGAGKWQRRDLNDHTLNLRHSEVVAATHQYPFGFTYPPPSVLLRVGFGSLGFEFGGGLWIALSGASLLFSLYASLKLLGIRLRPGAVVIGVAALLLVKYPFEFEYKYLNSNAMFLALVLAALLQLDRRPVFAGWWLALSIAFKLYSVVFLPWLLLTRRFRTFASAAVWTLGWFIVVPILYWGGETAWKVNDSWIESVHSTGSRDFPIQFAPFAYLTSLHATVLTAFQSLQLGEHLSAVLWTTRILQAIWVGGVLWVLCSRRRGEDSRSILTDASLLLLLPLPLSGQLQPHHLVVLLPSAVVLTATAVDRRQRSVLRWICLGAVVASFLLMEFGPAKPWRGLAIHATLILHAAGLGACRMNDLRFKPTEPPPGGSVGPMTNEITLNTSADKVEFRNRPAR